MLCTLFAKEKKVMTAYDCATKVLFAKSLIESKLWLVLVARAIHILLGEAEALFFTRGTDILLIHDDGAEKKLRDLIEMAHEITALRMRTDLAQEFRPAMEELYLVLDGFLHDLKFLGLKK